MKKLLTILCLILFSANISLYAENEIKVGIDEKLGNYLPLDTKFIDSRGDTLLLSQVFNKPTILALVYFECPGICNPLQTELAWVIDKVKLTPGKDFNVVSLSFNHNETPDISSRWKKNYLMGIKREFPDTAWRFLTGDSIAIKNVVEAVGFKFKEVGKEFTHPGALVAISPKGKIARYIYGTQYNPFDIKMALLEAQAGKTSPTMTKVLQYCFSYDPEGRRYTLNITRIIGSMMLLGIGIFASVLIFKKKKGVNING